jgi:hypothetical protein
MVLRDSMLQPPETAPKDGRRVRLEAELASDRGENAFNGPVYGVWNEAEQRWLLSPYIEDTIIDCVEGWWLDDTMTPALVLSQGEAPGTVCVTTVWTGGAIRTEVVTPTIAREIFQRYGQQINEEHLALHTRPILQLVP